ncbi:hypothetical protein PTSG_12639 [Salpingoeca rosetta]|uniref:Ubiquinol-cytochrome-c reductase complex assembly factor 3 n=1 Tax=Salpingoeca rosetta (strain ATCC 50818 / BSB-021) TaxID=946362 RepID=F2UGD7_SALR5|nr:uncharacterized protein PTSG_12639 [Salpingoeca rosetta]EGD75687.1 hypothetical protein PTSG_12639 [Salpingoeca rosetta]|eukprot:XP_004991608.1 hypothetical protein PTSG_12639 [Salpingoeca rosetta]
MGRGMTMLGSSAVIIGIGVALLKYATPEPEDVLKDMPAHIRRRELDKMEDRHRNNIALMEAIKSSADIKKD